MDRSSVEHERAARLTEMVTAHFDFIFRLLRRMGFDRSLSDDLCQDVFLVAVRRLETIEPGRERAFLYGAALRAAANARRSRWRQREAHGVDPSETDSMHPAAEETLARRRAAELLDRALSKLRPELSRVLVLADVLDLDAPEIAELERIPVGTVASRLRRARIKIRKSLARARAELRHGSP